MVSTNILCIIQWFKQTNLCIYQCKIFIKKKILLSICASAEQYDRCWVINVPSNKNCDFFSMGEFSALISTFHPASCYDCKFLSIVIITVQLLSRFWIFAIPWTEAHQASLSFTISWSLFKFMCIELLMSFNHLILCHSLLLLPSIFPSIRVFSNELAFLYGWPKYWSFSFSTSPSNEHSALISFRIDWFDFLAVQRTLKGLIQQHIFETISSSAFSLL